MEILFQMKVYKNCWMNFKISKLNNNNNLNNIYFNNMKYRFLIVGAGPAGLYTSKLFFRSLK